MNTAQLARSAYSNTGTSIRTNRNTEYDIFARITQRMTSAMRQGASDFVSLVNALHENRKLWRILASDVADDSNALPAPLRAQIFYLAEFTDLHTQKVLSGDATAHSLIEINTSVMRGLRGESGVAS